MFSEMVNGFLLFSDRTRNLDNEMLQNNEMFNSGKNDKVIKPFRLIVIKIVINVNIMLRNFDDIADHS